jgi:hypothetical protein
MLDTDENIFGGFSLTDWRKQRSYCHPNNSREHVLFTLKNLHNFPPRKFPFDAIDNYEAIISASEYGSYFGCDLGVGNDCNGNTTNFTYIFGSDSNNDILVGLGKRFSQVRRVLESRKSTFSKSVTKLLFFANLDRCDTKKRL